MYRGFKNDVLETKILPLAANKENKIQKLTYYLFNNENGFGHWASNETKNMSYHSFSYK